MPDMPPPKPVPAVVEKVDSVQGSLSPFDGLITPVADFQTQLRNGRLKLSFDSVKAGQTQGDIAGGAVGTELHLGNVRGAYQVDTPSKGALSGTAVEWAGLGPWGADPLSAYVAPRLKESSPFDRALELAGINSVDWQIETGRGSDLVRMRVFGEELRHGLEYHQGRFTYDIKGAPLEEWVSQFAPDNFKATGLRVSYRDQQWMLAPTASYDAGPFSITVSAGADELLGLTQGRTARYQHMFSGDPQRGEGVDLFGKPLTINSYTFDEFPGALVTRVDYGALSLLGATDPGSGRNILGVRGLHTFESLFGVPVALQGQGVYHQTFGAEMPYQDGASGTICVVPAIGEGVISLQLQGDLRRGEGPNFGVDSNRGDRSEPSWQVLFGLEILR